MKTREDWIKFDQLMKGIRPGKQGQFDNKADEDIVEEGLSLASARGSGELGADQRSAENESNGYGDAIVADNPILGRAARFFNTSKKDDKSAYDKMQDQGIASPTQPVIPEKTPEQVQAETKVADNAHLNKSIQARTGLTEQQLIEQGTIDTPTTDAAAGVARSEDITQASAPKTSTVASAGRASKTEQETQQLIGEREQSDLELERIKSAHEQGKLENDQQLADKAVELEELNQKKIQAKSWLDDEKISAAQNDALAAEKELDQHRKDFEKDVPKADLMAYNKGLSGVLAVIGLGIQQGFTGGNQLNSYIGRRVDEEAKRYNYNKDRWQQEWLNKNSGYAKALLKVKEEKNAKLLYEAGLRDQADKELERMQKKLGAGQISDALQGERDLNNQKLNEIQLNYKELRLQRRAAQERAAAAVAKKRAEQQMEEAARSAAVADGAKVTTKVGNTTVSYNDDSDPTNKKNKQRATVAKRSYSALDQQMHGLGYKWDPKKDDYVGGSDKHVSTVLDPNFVREWNYSSLGRMKGVYGDAEPPPRIVQMFQMPENGIDIGGLRSKARGQRKALMEQEKIYGGE
jgi:hypothetical protein